MSILSGFLKTKKHRKMADGNYKLQSEWTSSETVEMGDGNTLETNLGSIKGITSSLSSTDAGYALSASAGKDLQDQVTSIISSLIGYINAQNKIASITTAGASWEATENCWVTGYIIATVSGSRASIFVDGIPFAISMYSTSENVYVTIPVKKGQVVTTRDTGGYTLEVYGCL